MIKLIDIALDEKATEQHNDLEQALNEGYQIIGHSSFNIESRFGELNEFSSGNTPMERYTLYKSESSKPQTALDELVLTTITKLERDETSNNQRPMWRCRSNTEEGDKVNVFLNKDEPEKDSYHFFEQAGWGKFLMNMSVGESLRCAIHIAMRKNGKWWEVVKVQTKPQNIPDWAQENYTFDEIVSEEDETEGGAE